MSELGKLKVVKLEEKIQQDIDLRAEPLSHTTPKTQEQIEQLKAYARELFGDPMKVLEEHIIKNYTPGEDVKLADMIDKYFVVHMIPVIVTDEQSIYQHFAFNRKVKQPNVKNLMGSKYENGMFPRVGYMDKNLKIIDGQHDSTSSAILQNETGGSYPTATILVDRSAEFVAEMTEVLNSDGANWQGGDFMHRNQHGLDAEHRAKYERLFRITQELGVKEAGLKELLRSGDRKAWERAYKKGVIPFGEKEEQRVREELTKIRKIHGYITGYEQDQKSDDGRVNRKAQKPMTRAMVTGIRSFFLNTDKSHEEVVAILDDISDIKGEWLKNRAIGTRNQVRELLLEICS